uniref:Uncharacterized protein n=1 Tax=Ditylenchus dipsaci TaxID=166011 RepID=A0A915E1T9_9BILA
MGTQLVRLGITCLKIQGSSESASDGQVIRLPECPAPVSPPTVVAKPPAAAVVQPKMDPREMQAREMYGAGGMQQQQPDHHGQPSSANACAENPMLVTLLNSNNPHNSSSSSTTMVLKLTPVNAPRPTTATAAATSRPHAATVGVPQPQGLMPGHHMAQGQFASHHPMYAQQLARQQQHMMASGMQAQVNNPAQHIQQQQQQAMMQQQQMSGGRPPPDSENGRENSKFGIIRFSSIQLSLRSLQNL